MGRLAWILTFSIYVNHVCSTNTLYGAQIKRDISELDVSYDYIIAGGGTSGLTVADRLTAAFPSRSVLVVEYGDLVNSSVILTPAVTVSDPQYQYQIVSQQESGLNNRRFPVTVGKIVGGCSAINAQMFDRGSAADYDDWGDISGEEYRNAGWTWKGLLPYFKKSTTFTPPSASDAQKYEYTWDEKAAWGGNGAIQAIYPPFQWPSEKVIRRAWRELGAPAPKEGSGGDAYGVFWFPSSQDPKTQTRSYARTGHYDPVANRSNYHLLVGHRVNEVILQARGYGSQYEAKGVKIQAVSSNSSIIEIAGNQEIILAAGAIHTPGVLQRSGIGPKDVLDAAKIPVKVELPGVGQNFQDHPYTSLSFELTKDLVPNFLSVNQNQTALQEARDQYAQNRTGPLTLSGGNSGAFLPLSSATNDTTSFINALILQKPIDYLPNGTHATIVAGYTRQVSALRRAYLSQKAAVFEYPIASFASIMAFLKPLSRGNVNIDPVNIFAEPLVNYRAFSNPLDVELTLYGLVHLRRLYTTPSAQSLGPVERSPGGNVTTDDEWRGWIRTNVRPSFYHPVGTAALGPKNQGGVVGPDLKVHGVERLRVVDASVMPLIPGTHTSSTVYAVAEKAADIIIKASRRH